MCDECGKLEPVKDGEKVILMPINKEILEYIQRKDEQERSLAKSDVRRPVILRNEG